MRRYFCFNPFFDQEDAKKEGGIFGGIRFPTRRMLKHEGGVVYLNSPLRRGWFFGGTVKYN